MDGLIEEYGNILISLLFSGIIIGVFLKILIKVMIYERYYRSIFRCNNICNMCCSSYYTVCKYNDRIQGYYPGVFESDYIQIVIDISM